MGVYRNRNLRGKQWVCTLKLGGAKSITLHKTQLEAIKQHKKLVDMVNKGTFVETYKKPDPQPIKMGICWVVPDEEGIRCGPSIFCSRYRECLRIAWDHDLKGWRRIHDNHSQGNAD